MFQKENKWSRVASCVYRMMNLALKLVKGSGQECSNLVKGRPKRSGNKNKSRLLSLQGPLSSGSDEVMFKKPNSKDNNSAIGGEAGLKKGTWERFQNKPRTTLELTLTNVLGPKRNSKDILSEAEKAELAKKKNKVSNSEGLALTKCLIQRGIAKRF
nr:hypothetical protein CFP56_25565 [Quercus suber]